MSANSTTEKKKRTRWVFNEWVRDPKGKILEKPPPTGIRSPNDIIWGHTMGEFFWIKRIPGINVMTIWTRSMITEYGEKYGERWADQDIQISPRLVRPWPVLRVPRDLDPEQTYSIVDEGCGFDHEFQDCPTRVDEVVIEATVVDTDDDASAVEKPSGADQLETTDVFVGASTPLDQWHNLDSSKAADAPGIKYEAAVPIEPSNEAVVPTESLAATSVDVAGSVAAPVRPAKSPSTSFVEVEPEAPLPNKPQSSHPQSPIMPFDSLTPKLEEFIPVAFFPDLILVQDPSGICFGKEYSARKAQAFKTTEGMMGSTTRYIRRFPPPEKAGAAILIAANEKEKRPPQVANLNLTAAPLLGVGHHSSVVRGGLRLPKPVTAKSPSGEVSVACKFAFDGSEERRLLANEAAIYNRFPKHLQEQYCGLNLVTPIKHPVPVGACVPKFFGYYVSEEGQAAGLSPMLLLEERGVPVMPATFTADQRSECYSLFLRLHYADFMQGSCYVRNIMVQPGPISKPPDQRAHCMPSFRIIDFGRAQSWQLEKEKYAPLSMLDAPPKPVVVDDKEGDDTEENEVEKDGDVVGQEATGEKEKKLVDELMDVVEDKKEETEDERVEREKTEKERAQAAETAAKEKAAAEATAKAAKEKGDLEKEEKAEKRRKERRNFALAGISSRWWEARDYEIRKGQEELQIDNFDF